MISLDGAERGVSIFPASLIRRTGLAGFYALVIFFCGDAAAQPPPDPDIFQAGVYADSARALDCTGGTVGAEFVQYLWAWVPPDEEANYLTVRFRFPENIDRSERPILNALVSTLVITDFGDGGIEWNFILADCPTGWILLFRQGCTILSTDPAEIAISGPPSLARNCAFVLEGLGVLSTLRINDGNCAPVSATHSTWGGIKAMYR